MKCRLKYVFGPFKFIFPILVHVSLCFFNVHLYKIFCSFLVHVSLRFFDFGRCKILIFSFIVPISMLLQGPKLEKHKFIGTKKEKNIFQGLRLKRYKLTGTKIRKMNLHTPKKKKC